MYALAAGVVLAVPSIASCSSSGGEESMPGGGAAAGGNATSSGGIGVSGGAMVAAGRPGSAGTANGTGGAAGSGSLAGMGGTINGSAAGMGGAAGSGVGGGFVGGGAAGAPPAPPLDCGGKGAVIENHGPTTNRVNYVILGDGYSQTELDTTFMAHIQTAMTKRFSDPIGQAYLRYRKFVNVCAIKIPSTPICGSSAFRCCGNDSSRLASCDRMLANDAISANLPESFEVDWRAVVLNGSSWWNTGATLMLWSGANRDAAGAALHEGGHGFHQLADEYGGCGSDRVNNTAQTSGGPWGAWIDFNQTPGTGRQGFFECEGATGYRPSDNSMMNSLFGNDPDTSFNAVSREKMIMDIWRIVESPWDSVVPPAGAVTNPAALTLNVIDPIVINVDWSVDGNMVAVNGGPTFNIGAAGLAPGTHMVSARAYDNAGMDLVRQTSGTTFNRQYWAMNASKTVTWTVTIQ